jgi:hypothetical protein
MPATCLFLLTGKKLNYCRERSNSLSTRPGNWLQPLPGPRLKPSEDVLVNLEDVSGQLFSPSAEVGQNYLLFIKKRLQSALSNEIII